MTSKPGTGRIRPYVRSDAMFQLTPGDFEKARETLVDLQARYPALNDAQRILLEAQLAAAFRFIERAREAIRQN